jgi:hypothetical protein
VLHLNFRTDDPESRSNNLWIQRSSDDSVSGCRGGPSVSGIWYESGGEPFVAMMQTADLPDGDDASDPAWLDRARVRAILVESKMRPRSVVVFDVGRKNTPQMALVEDHDVVETFATDRTDHALDASVLPGRAWRRDDFCDPHRLNTVVEVRAIRRVAITQQIARSGVPRERLSYLTR